MIQNKKAKPGQGLSGLILTTLTLTLFALGGCGGSDGNGNPTNPNGNNTGNTGANTVTAAVDGTSWTAVATQAVNNGGVVGIGASDINGNLSIGLGWVGTETGTYSLGPGIIANATLLGPDGTTWQAMDEEGSGTIIVTSLTSEAVAGTFSFTAPRVSGTGTPLVRVVTNGSFNVEF